MSDRADDTISEGVAAWSRIRECSRKSFDDWIAVAQALAVGRSQAMQEARANRPIGTSYVRAFGSWKRDCGFSDISPQETYRGLQVLEHLSEIRQWRDSLPESHRRRMNSPSACWHSWKRATKVETGTPTRRCVKGTKPKGNGHAIHWNGDAIRRAASAIRETYSTDFFITARRALEAAVRNQADLVELLPPNTVAMSALPRRTDVVSAAGYVG
jgi:hypothetical protein